VAFYLNHLALLVKQQCSSKCNCMDDFRHLGLLVDFTDDDALGLHGLHGLF
jgi:hypothetical protein